MSQIMTAKQVVEMALGAGGAFPTTDNAAAPEHMRRGMTFLDLLMGQNAGTGKLFFLVPSPETVFFTIVNGTGSYDLIGALGANAPSNGVQFPIAAYLQYPSGDRRPLPIVTRDQFMSARNPAETGPPRMVYIDRLPDSQLYIHPIPPTTDPNSYVVILDVQTYAPNVAPAGVTGTQAQSSLLTQFRQAWNRYLVFQLAHDLFSGPIFKISETSLNRFGKIAAEAKAELLEYENQEHDDTPPIGAAYDDDYGFHGGGGDESYVSPNSGRSDYYWLGI
jgi:hypothetical protein